MIGEIEGICSCLYNFEDREDPPDNYKTKNKGFPRSVLCPSIK